MSADYKYLLNLNYKEIKTFLLGLDDAGVLQEILPELTALKGVDIVDGQRHKDNYFHTLQVVENTYKETSNIWLRLVSILHDIGKAPTKKFIKGQGWTFANHEYIGGKMLKKIFKRLEIPMIEFDYVKKIVVTHGRPKELTKDVSDSALRRLSTEMGTVKDLQDLFTFCKCDITTKFPDKLLRQQEGYDKLYDSIIKVVEQDIKDEWRCPINGHMIMEYFGEGVKGRVLGEIKKKIEQAIKSGDVSDDYDSALIFMKTIKI